MQADTNLNGVKLLIVDDEPLVTLELVDYLIVRGAQIVGPCHTLEQAMDLVGEHRPDAAVLNVELNGELVRPLAEALESIGVPFVFETGFDPTRVAELTGTGEHEVVQKPYRRRDVLFALGRALESRSVPSPIAMATEEPGPGVVV